MTRLARAIAALLLAALTVAGSAVAADDETPQFQGGPGRTGFYPGAVGGGGAVVFVCDLAGTVQALDGEFGFRRWKRALSDPIRSAPVPHAGRVFVCAGTRLFSLDIRSGDVAWERDLQQDLTSAPSAARGILHLSGARHLFAMSVETGETRWQVEIPGGVCTPAVEDGGVFLATRPLSSAPDRPATASVAAVDSLTGTIRWRSDAGSRVTGSPLVVSGLVCFGTDDGKFYALDTEDGRVRWTWPIDGEIQGAPTGIPGLIFFTSRDGKLGAHDWKTGAQLWSLDGVCGTPVVSDVVTLVIARSPGTALGFVDPVSGWASPPVHLDQAVRYGLPAIAWKRLHVIARTEGRPARLVTVAVESGELLWQAPLEADVSAPLAVAD